MSDFVPEPALPGLRPQQRSDSPRRRKGRALSRLALLVAALALFWICLPVPEGLLNKRPFSSVRILDRAGRLLRELRSAEDGRSSPLADNTIPPLVRDAFLAAEDRRFGQHPGVDPLAVGRALLQNAREGRIVSGASTIAQQLARRLKPHSRTLLGKVYEAMWAARLSLHLSAETLLLEYLNRVPLGNSLYGVEAASAFYFGRPAHRLSLGQAALLAGMAASPARFDPFRHPQAAQQRMQEILRRIEVAGFRTHEAVAQAAQTPLDLERSEAVFEAPHFLAWLANARDADGLGAAISIQTTLDPALQDAASRALQTELAGLESRRVHQGAVLVLDNASGEVLAYVGSRNFLDDAQQGQNDGVRAQRQPGSALKPFAYGLALSSGYTPASVLFDLETRLSGAGADWLPRNYDRRVHGPVRLRAALANSFNIPAVRLVDALTPERVLAVLRTAGLSSLNRSAAHYGAGLVLGNGDVTLWELARAYRGLALGGEVRPLKTVLSAQDPLGQALVPREEHPTQRFLPADAVALLTDILADEKARATAFGLDNALRLAFPVAVKTGTSRAHVDNWCVGFTREVTVAVWVGNFDGTAMEGVSGIAGAGPVFKRVMNRAMEGRAPAPLVPLERFEEVEVCPLSGLRRTEACPGLLQERFLPATAPRQSCSMHRMRAINPRTGEPVPCQSPGSIPQRTVELGANLAAWGQAQGLQHLPSAIPECPGSSDGPQAQQEDEPPRLLSPRSGEQFRVDPTLPRRDQTLPVRIWAPSGTDELELLVHVQPASSLQPPIPEEETVSQVPPRLLLRPPFRTRMALVPGRWTLELRDPKGNRTLSLVRFQVQ